MNTANQKHGVRKTARGASAAKSPPAVQAPAPVPSRVEKSAQPTTPIHPAEPLDPATEPYIGKAEVAQRLGRTVRTVDKLMHKGRIPFYKFDWRVAFRWSEVQAHFAETCRVCRRNEVKR